VRGGRQNDQHSAAAALIAKAPPSAEGAFAILPQNSATAVLIVFTRKSGQKYLPWSERAAGVHNSGRTDYFWRN
jgi:hypothetical protein